MQEKYISLTDILELQEGVEFNFSGGKYLGCFKRAEHIYDELQCMITATNLDTSCMTARQLRMLLLHPTRLTRAIIDKKEVNDGYVGLVRESLDVILSCYKRKNVKQKIEAFWNALPVDIQQRKISQESDASTWNAMKPAKSTTSAEALCERFPNSDVLFIALSHGGLAAGADVFLRYTAKTNVDSTFYTACFSTDKFGDCIPLLAEDEKELLQHLANQHRATVMFDEDVATGNTMALAHHYFTILFENDVDLLTNKVNTAALTLRSREKNHQTIANNLINYSTFFTA